MYYLLYCRFTSRCSPSLLDWIIWSSSVSPGNPNPFTGIDMTAEQTAKTIKIERNNFIFISDLNLSSEVLVDQFKRDWCLVIIIWRFYRFSFCLLLMLILLWLDQRITFTWSFFQSLNQFKGRNKKRPLWKKMFNGFNLIR